MRRFSASCFFALGCCFAYGVNGPQTFGADDVRTSVFRVLTSEQSEGMAAAAPVEQEREIEAPRATETPPPQADEGPRMSSGAPIYSQAVVHRPANFYSGPTARQTMSQFPRRAPVQATDRRTVRRMPKPFTGMEHEPTLSPYLILDEDEDDTQNVPTYFTQVLPRVQQQQTNRSQQGEIQQLRGQLQTVMTGGGGAPQYEASRGAGMGTSARYMNTGQFYRGMR